MAGSRTASNRDRPGICLYRRCRSSSIRRISRDWKQVKILDRWSDGRTTWPATRSRVNRSTIGRRTVYRKRSSSWRIHGVRSRAHRNPDNRKRADGDGHFETIASFQLKATHNVWAGAEAISSHRSKGRQCSSGGISICLSQHTASQYSRSHRGRYDSASLSESPSADVSI